MTKTLALFDVDGTLTTADTMFAFVRHVVGPVQFVLGLVWMAPMLALARVGLLDRGRSKGRMLRWFFRNHSRSALEAAAETFTDTVLPGLLRNEGIARLQTHRENGDTVYLVSASLDLWLRPFARRQQVPLLCTQAAWEDGRFTGLASPNCRGEEKVRRVRAVVNPLDFETIDAYGDSSGDDQMLAIATRSHFKPFRSA
jgi:phosphatidylglycerophosphatase C